MVYKKYLLTFEFKLNNRGVRKIPHIYGFFVQKLRKDCRRLHVVDLISNLDPNMSIDLLVSHCA